MTVNLSTVLRAPHTVAVAPTETTLDSLTRTELRTAKRVTIQVYNADAAQTFSGVIYRKQTGMTTWAPSTMPDFSSVGPLASVMADLDVEGTDLLEIRGTMSGAGGNVQIAAARKGATP